ncbi:hypothetical protein RCO28_18830 [Streptomyces sp. LHD-70]|uniref:hypothetical protein n=1 Tax=Streptomyces sp. LHD-70 TaxID=3072140 RepID=UPI00280D2392|nr:hypothetical protein [Streptomyces sp. LHD-70]MDQ8704527.1 hypothetical protein [Streptomyces sp. LHD-70]
MVLAVVGLAVRQDVEEWWLARQACGGAVPREVIDARMPDDARLLPAEEKLIEETGWYRCDLRFEEPGGGRDQVLHVVATTDQEEQGEILYDTFEFNESWSWRGQVPEGLPGILQVNDTLQLLIDCPALGKDAKGSPRKLLVRSGIGPWSGESAPPELAKSAASLANEASRRLGCGAEPLKPPTGKVYREPRPLAPKQAAGTPCAWTARADLPAGARVSVSGTRTSHAVRCDLHWGAKFRDPKVMLSAYYGDWGKRLRFDDDGRIFPGAVQARCRGEAVIFKAATEPDASVTEKQLRVLAQSFARAELRQRGC